MAKDNDIAMFGGCARPADGVRALGADEVREALKRRATQVQDAVIKKAIQILRVEDQKAGRTIQRDVLTYIKYVNERFLAAFAKEIGDRPYALKGGNAIAVLRANAAKFPARFASPRETRDIDMRLVGPLTEAEIRALFRCTVGHAGFHRLAGLTFGEPKVTMLEARDGYLPGAKVECSVFLGPPLVDKGKGTPFKLEMSFGELLPGSWSVSPYPTLAELAPGRPAWADQQPFDIAHVVPEMMFADKLHAVARYGLANTRLKDLFDLHCLAAQYDLAPGLVRDCLLHVFREFKEEHLMVASAAALPGLDPERFATPQNATTWRSDWRNWTGVAHGQAGGLAALELPETLRSIAAAVDGMGLFGPETLAVAEEAKLCRLPMPALLASVRDACVAPDPVALALLRDAAAQDRGTADPGATRALAFATPGVPAAARLARGMLGAAAAEARLGALLAEHGAALAGTPETAMPEATLAALRRLRAALLEAAPEEALATVPAAAAAVPTQVGRDFPLRALLTARLGAQARDLADVAAAVQRAAEILGAVPEVARLERGAAAARAALRLDERGAQLAETAALARTAAAFADDDDRRRLEAVRTALGSALKVFGGLDHRLARTAAIRADIANNSLGKAPDPDAAAAKARETLARDAGVQGGDLARLRAAFQPLLPRAAGPAVAHVPDPDMDAVLAPELAGPAPGR